MLENVRKIWHSFCSLTGMGVQIKDIIGVGVASLLLFPVVFFAVLLATGTARLEIGDLGDDTRRRIAGYMERSSPEQERQDLEQSKLYEANLLKEEELEEKRRLIKEEADRLELLKLETSQNLEKINQNREDIDKRVGESRTLSDQKIEELAQLYATIKPIEAAPILMNLDDISIARIIKKVPDARAQGKLLAAIGALNTKRAASVTKVLGWREKGL
jgi:flagellar motility protein MotE (MotC chaperone)